MSKIKNIIVSIALVMGLGLVLIPSTNVSALDLFPSCSSDSSNKLCNDDGSNASGIIKNLVNTLLFVLGIVSVVMMIYGGMVYTTSAGDSSKITKAKNIIIYSVVGMVVAMSAFAIANFVVGVIK